MRKTWIILVLAAAANGTDRHAADVVVYIHHGTEPAEVVAVAEAQAARMLASVGIRVRWELGTPRYQGRAEVIEAVMVEQPDDHFRPGTLACATLGKNSGTRIEVFYDQVRTAGPAGTVPAILAHVLVHEIVHVLEGIDRHAEIGVMKAHWEAADFYAMRSGPLPFAAEDVRLIGGWKSSRQSTVDSQQLAPPLRGAAY